MHWLRLPLIIVLLLACCCASSATIANAQEQTPQQKQASNDAWEQLATAYKLYQSKKLAEALKLAVPSLDVLRSTTGEDSVPTARARNLVGQILQDQYKFDAARVQLERVVEIRKKLHGERGHETGIAWLNLGVLFVESQKFDDGLRCMQTALEISRETKGPRSLDGIRPLGWIAKIRRLQGDYAASLTTYQEALRLIRSNPDLEPGVEGWTLRDIGETYHEMKDHPAALKHYEQTLALFRRIYGDDSTPTALAADNVGLGYLMLEDPVNARKYVEFALEIRKRKLGPDDTNICTSYEHLANVLELLGDLPGARETFEKVLVIRERTQGKSAPETAVVYSNLGELLVKLGEPASGRKYLEQVVSIYQSIHGENHPNTARSQMALATCLLQQRDYTGSRDLYKKSLAVLVAIGRGDQLDSSDVLNNLSTAHAMLDEHEEAISCSRRAAEIRRKLLGDTHSSTLRFIANLAFELESVHKTDEVVRLLDETRRGTRSYVSRLLPNLSEREQLSYLANHHEKQFKGSLQVAWLNRENPNFVARSSEWLVNGKAITQEALAAKALRARDSSTPVSSELSRVRAQIAALAFSTPAPGQEEARRQERRKLDEEEQRLARQAGADDTAAIESPWIDFSAVRAAVPKNAAYVDIVFFEVFNVHGRGEERKWLKPRYAAWVVPPTGQGDVRIIDLGEAEAIDQAVLKVRGAIEQPELIRERGEEEAEKEMRKASSMLSALVLAPIIDALPKETETILLSPDRQLWLTPWTALPLSDGRFAIEKYEFQFFVSGRDLLSRDAATRKTTQPVIVADPDFDLSPLESQAANKAVLREAYRPSKELVLRSIGSASTLPKVARLPGSAVEAQAIGPRLAEYSSSQPVVYTERYAQEAIVKLIQRPKLLVLSTHGFFLEDKQRLESAAPKNDPTRSLSADGKNARPENPLLCCGLLLAGCNARDPSVGGDDGVLTGLEICGIDLRGTELVVLSACQTGQGEIRNGEGVAGLRQAFQLAGAQAVVSSLWQVPDWDSALIMNDFVTGLAAGSANGKALRDAQLRRIASRREKNGAAHPYFWAAWTVTGK